MRKFLIFNFSFLIAVLLLASCAKQPAQPEQEQQQEQEQEATESQSQSQGQSQGRYIDFTAVTPDGQELSLSDLVGKTDYVLVDFWASWCGPCRRLIPVLKEMYAGQPEGRLQIFSCSVDQDIMAWQVALNEEQMPWPQAREDADHECADLYGVQYIPHTVLIDRDGHIVGVNLEEPEIEAILFAE
jgi:thiol-disulfide isomerase/thioredoxin